MLLTARPGPLLALAATLALVGAGSRSAAAPRTPRPGGWYEDAVDLGFRLRLPKGWDYIPAEPGEPTVLGRCSAGTARMILAPRESAGWRYQAWILKFDRRPGPRLDACGKPLPEGAQDLAEWLRRTPPSDGPRGWKEDRGARRTSRLGAMSVTEYEFTQRFERTTEVRLYAMVYRLTPDLEVAYVFNGPDGRKWTRHRNAARQLARSLEPVEVHPFELGAGTGTPRERKRAELTKEVSKSGEWQLYETPHYFLVTNHQDRAFVEEALERVEAIRAVFVRVFPPSKAERLARLAGRGAAQDDWDVARTTRAASGRAAARATTSVVRICATHEQYRAYGGPAGTAGYWSQRTEELVLFDDRQVRGRDATWNTLNHEAFHQYIHGYFGELSPHSWFDEGHGDHFGAYEYEHGRFSERRSPERIRTAQEVLRRPPEQVPPLSELVRWGQSEYYGGRNRYRTRGFENYALGWSFVYFLRTGEGRAKGWEPAFGTILDAYLEALVRYRDLDQAVDQAFQGVDWDALESAWKEYTLE